MWFARKVDLQVLPAGREALSGAQIARLKNQLTVTFAYEQLDYWLEGFVDSPIAVGAANFPFRLWFSGLK
jgi:hypothetical protein